MIFYCISEIESIQIDDGGDEQKKCNFIICFRKILSQDCSTRGIFSIHFYEYILHIRQLLLLVFDILLYLLFLVLFV